LPSSKKQTTAKRQTKTVGQKAVDRVGRRPISATALAQKMGLPNHNGIARELGKAVSDGRLVKTDRGYQKA
jgi:phage I-like protein